MEAVFISSRFHESDRLRVLREVLTRELTKRFTMRPLNLDDGRADDRSPVERSLTEAADASVVVLLLGATYGAPDVSGRSITEREFDVAVRAQVPVLAYRLVGEDEDESARAFRARVEALVTVGALDGSPALDAARIVADVYECLAAGGAAEPAPSSSVVIGSGAIVMGATIAGRNITTGGSDG